MTATAFVVYSLFLPAMAQTRSVEDLHADLQMAVCLNDWEAAITASSQIIVSSEITDQSREEMVGFRHQLQDWLALEAEIEVSGCQAIAVETAAVPAQSTRQRLNWHRALASVTEGRSLRSQSTVAAISSTSQPSIDLSCMPSVGSDRRISSGSMSSRWSYEILQSGSGYYTRYWEQADPCGTWNLTLDHSTQDDAYEEFRAIATNVSATSTSEGRCLTPDDIAADGSRCGGRAASARPGGRF